MTGTYVIDRRRVAVGACLAAAFVGVLAHQSQAAPAAYVNAAVSTGNCTVTSTGSYRLTKSARGATLTVATYVSRFAGQPRTRVATRSYKLPQAAVRGARSYKFSVPRTRNGWRYSTIAAIRVATPSGSELGQRSSGDRVVTCR